MNNSSVLVIMLVTLVNTDKIQRNGGEWLSLFSIVHACIYM